MVSTHHGLPVHTGFDGIAFRVQRTSGGVYPDWQQERARPVFHIPNSNRSVVQHMGAGLATIALRAWFDDVATYRAMTQKIGVVGTLTLLAGYTRAVGSGAYHLDGRDYDDLGGVELVDVTDVDFAVGLENVQATLVFSRAMDPLTGEAV